MFESTNFIASTKNASISHIPLYFSTILIASNTFFKRSRVDILLSSPSPIGSKDNKVLIRWGQESRWALYDSLLAQVIPWWERQKKSWTALVILKCQQWQQSFLYCFYTNWMPVMCKNQNIIVESSWTEISVKDDGLENQFSRSFACHFSLFSAGHFGSLCESH